jgi:anti-anti-sigma factor
MISAPSLLLDHSLRQIIRALALVILVSGVIVTLILTVLLIITPNLNLGIVLGFNILDILACWAALALVRARPIWQSILPLVALLTLGVCGVSLLLPDIKTSLSPLIVLVVLLISMIGNRRLTVISTIGYAVLVMLLFAVSLPAGWTFSFGPTLTLFQALSAGVVVVLIWVISDRMTMSMFDAMVASTDRAAEAEAARAEAEAARAEIEQRSADQARLLDLVQTLELPVLSVGQGVLIVPLVGSIDSRRIDEIQRRLLQNVMQRRAHTVVLDVTGISLIDTTIARRLLQIAQAVRLLGAQTLLSGISAHVAQTLVSLGVALDDLQPVADLDQALAAIQQN